MKLIVNVINLDDKIVGLSLNDSDFNDFEDALQYYSAIENGIEIIITRNLKDFQKSKILVLTAEQFPSANITHQINQPAKALFPFSC